MLLPERHATKEVRVDHLTRGLERGESVLAGISEMDLPGPHATRAIACGPFERVT